MVTPTGTFEYQVESTKIVWPSNVDVLKPTPAPTITLVTCYPFNYVGSAPKRFIVHARQIVIEAKAEGPQKGS
jgi:sortase A